ncbi:MAG: aminotransferase class V-fold PLP-dependent enzyme [candidate division KSB1 bacterium]|nr:aminotransferase class V-fold PLP-dependent enzyme [candidate division KSB1 bacterium]MDZ7304368.1 aminotransferase class V-fold PLP-dependent enzyme [candidate division KSB1 bacterium]MDZ7313517.1 aminotransferase class V-fold PLP-dependent enzyme [candidate division KSB1 bacterium]
MDSVSCNGKLFSSEVLSQARALFPHTAQGKIYLNHASTSPLSTRVVGAMTAHLHERSVGSIDNYLRDMQKKDECKALVQRLIHAESAERIALVGNTSDALNIIASGIPWKSGDRVLLNDMEFPANVYPYLHLRRLGVELDIIRCPNGKITPEMIEAALTPKTRLVALSAVQFLTGYRADLSAIGEICRRRGAFFVVDGIQAVGAVQVDVQAMKIDALAAGSQKWQMAPHGTGFLYLTEELQSRIQQQYLGWLAVQEAWDFFNYNQPLASSARRYEGGTANIPGIWGMHAALTTLLEFGIANIESHILALTQILTDELRKIDGIELFSPLSASERAGIVTIKLPSRMEANAVLQTISSRNITISLREGKLRYSPHFYNSPEEIMAAAAVTREALMS